MNVYQLFEQTFDRPPSDVTLSELPVNSNCGNDCAVVIRAAQTVLDARKGALGEDHATHIVTRQLAAIVEETIIVYWRG